MSAAEETPSPTAQTTRRVITAGVVVIVAVVGGLQLVRRTDRESRDLKASAKALEDAGLAPVPTTATNRDVHLDCSLTFCGIRTSFADKAGVAAWVRNSPTLASAATSASDSSTRYTVPGQGKSPESVVTVDLRAGNVVVEVAIERERCTELCGEGW